MTVSLQSGYIKSSIHLRCPEWEPFDISLPSVLWRDIRKSTFMCNKTAEITLFNKQCVTHFQVTCVSKRTMSCYILSISMVLPGGGVGTTKALSSTSLRGSVTSTLSPADTTSSLTAVVNKESTMVPKEQDGIHKVGMATKRLVVEWSRSISTCNDFIVPNEMVLKNVFLYWIITNWVDETGFIYTIFLAFLLFA